MNLQEMKLAFEMNVNGDFPNKVEHYQAFSRDYFCNVLNRYIQQKQVVLMKEAKMPKNEHQSIAPPDNYSEKILLDIIQDRINSGSGSPLTESVPIATRFEMLCSMFEVNYGEKTIAGYRINACDELLRELTKKKNEAKALNKYGLELEITNQIARIKAQKLITEADEAMIEAKVLRLLYANVILHWPEMEFVNHVKESIQLLKNHAKSEKNNS